MNKKCLYIKFSILRRIKESITQVGRAHLEIELEENRYPCEIKQGLAIWLLLLATSNPRIKIGGC